MPRIVDWEEFKKQPPGTVFWEYQPEIFYNLAVLTEFIDHGDGVVDFWMIPLNPWIEHSCFDEEREGNIAFADTQSRWGSYDYNQLFCILDDDDKNLFVKRLKWHG